MTTEPMGAREYPDTAFCTSSQQAVDESRRLLDQYWTTWCTEHDISPVPVPVTQVPVVSQVGLDPDSLEWVALIRFDVRVDSQRLHGLVRGPADDAVFTVRPPAAGEARTRRRWSLGRRGRSS